MVAQKVITLVQGVRTSMPKLRTRKLYHILKRRLAPLNIGRDKLFRILKANNLLIKQKRNYHITTDSYHRYRKYKNLVSTLEVEGPEHIWVSDIIYTGNRKNLSYLALITDAYSKKIISYNVSNSLNASGSISALEMAIKNRKYKQKSLIYHSDRGLQYCSNEYQKTLKESDITPSMTEQYDPYENAVAERVNEILKQEFVIAKHNVDIILKTTLIKNAIRVYNEQRPHLSNNMLTPIQMHQQNILKPKRYKSKNLNNNIIVYLGLDTILKMTQLKLIVICYLT